MFEYLRNTADERTFGEIVLDILNDVRTEWRDRDGYKSNLYHEEGLYEDIKELVGRYAPILAQVDRVYLGAEVDE